MFAHFLIPHSPYVVDAEGRCLTQAESDKRTRRDNFVGQVEHANREILKFVDRALSQPGPKPVIILQADEGPYPVALLEAQSKPGGFDWENASDEFIREKVGILNALYLPGMSKAEAEAAATPVNTFRVVLNHYFGAKLELLPDSTYIHRDKDHFYDLIDVTDRAHWPVEAAARWRRACRPRRERVNCPGWLERASPHISSPAFWAPARRPRSARSSMPAAARTPR